MTLFDQLRALSDELNAKTPWVGWAKQNPVSLVLTDHIPFGQGYVIRPQLGVEHVVVLSAETMRQIRRIVEQGIWPPTDQDIAEIIAWQKSGYAPREDVSA